MSDPAVPLCGIRWFSTRRGNRHQHGHPRRFAPLPRLPENLSQRLALAGPAAKLGSHIPDVTVIAREREKS